MYILLFYSERKKYAEELRIVRCAIAVFQKQWEALQTGVLKGNRKHSKILERSQSISKQTGLVDKKGKALHIPEPIAGWIKRREVIEQKIATAAKKKAKK